MPFRTVLCLCAAAGLLAADQPANEQGSPTPNPRNFAPKDFVNPDLGGLLKQPRNFPKLFRGQPFVSVTEPQQCSIPLKSTKVQNGHPDPRGTKWVGPHPERIDPIYGPNPAPACREINDEKSAKGKKPSK